jgi:hypothetical protein
VIETGNFHAHLPPGKQSASHHDESCLTERLFDDCLSPDH